MVAISLYRGNLHKVSSAVSRRWPCPKPTISLKDFRILLRRRERALERLRSQIPLVEQQQQQQQSTTSPNPSANPNQSPKHNPNRNLDPDCGDKIADQPEAEKLYVSENGLKSGEVKLIEKADNAVVVEEKKDEEEEEEEKKLVVEVNLNVEKPNTEDSLSDVEKRRKEVMSKLEVLKERKHSLVQVLKQIQNAEDQLKRQNTSQTMSGRPPHPLQVDIATDSGSMTRTDTPRIGSDGNIPGHLARMSSDSPSSESQLRKPAPNTVSHSARATGSPSQFAPAGQGLSVSVSGTSYLASSPSPAASGGTSVLRDGRLSSPWN